MPVPSHQRNFFAVSDIHTFTHIVGDQTVHRLVTISKLKKSANCKIRCAVYTKRDCLQFLIFNGVTGSFRCTRYIYVMSQLNTSRNKRQRKINNTESAWKDGPTGTYACRSFIAPRTAKAFLHKILKWS